LGNHGKREKMKNISRIIENELKDVSDSDIHVKFKPWYNRFYNLFFEIDMLYSDESTSLKLYRMSRDVFFWHDVPRNLKYDPDGFFEFIREYGVGGGN